MLPRRDSEHVSFCWLDQVSTPLNVNCLSTSDRRGYCFAFSYRFELHAVQSIGSGHNIKLFG